VPETAKKAERISGPTAEPVTLSEAKKQLEIASSDTSHDTHLSALIGAAREQWEHDTDRVTCYASFRIRTSDFYDNFGLLKGPIQSITSIQYFDGNNTLATLDPSLYQLHDDEIRLGYQVSLPAWAARWDAWAITYRCGYSQDGQSVPDIDKAAILMLVAHYFENRDMMMSEALQSMRPYEALVRRFMRSSYP
jgi:uncharacterized phiE125 gp8 family phage protein